MISGPTVEDIRFTSDTEEINQAFVAAVRLFGLESYCNVTSVGERYRILLQSASPHEVSNTTAPADSLVVDVPGDGDCMWYCIVGILLGRRILKDESVIEIFKKNFVKLVFEHRDKIVPKDTKRGEKKGGELNPNLLSFGHEPYRRCCVQSKKDSKEFHNNSFGILYNSDQGKLKYYDLEEWARIVLLPHTWGGDEILRLVACFTGFSFITHNFKCDSHPTYFSYLSKADYGFPKPLHGGEILLQWRNSNHYQILVPKDPSQLDKVVRPYKLRKIVSDGGVIEGSKKASTPGSRLGEFLKKAKKSRIEKEKGKFESEKGDSSSQREKKDFQKRAKKEEKEKKENERKNFMEEFETERKKFAEVRQKESFNGDIKKEPKDEQESSPSESYNADIKKDSRNGQKSSPSQNCNADIKKEPKDDQQDLPPSERCKADIKKEPKEEQDDSESSGSDSDEDDKNEKLNNLEKTKRKLFNRINSDSESDPDSVIPDGEHECDDKSFKHANDLSNSDSEHRNDYNYSPGYESENNSEESNSSESEDSSSSENEVDEDIKNSSESKDSDDKKYPPSCESEEDKDDIKNSPNSKCKDSDDDKDSPSSASEADKDDIKNYSKDSSECEDSSKSEMSTDDSDFATGEESSETEVKTDKSKKSKKKLKGRKRDAFLKANRECKFKSKWLDDKDIHGDFVSTYLDPPLSGKGEAVCRLCFSKINVRRMGWSAIQQHASGKKHRALMSDLKLAPKVEQHFVPINTNASTVAEIGFNTLLACHNLSPLLMNCITPLCKKVFHDSKIASKMTQGATKATYGLQRGLAKTEQERLLSTFRFTPFSLQCDVGKKGNAKYAQHILRGYDESEGKVVSRFYFCKKNNFESSENLADNVFTKTSQDKLNIKNCLVQCQCDSCNVMRGKKAGFMKRLSRKAPITGRTDLGGDQLHHLHNSSKKAFKKGFSGVEKILDDIKYTIGASVKKMDSFQDCCIQLGLKKNRLKKYIKSRFLSSYECVEDLSMRLPAVKKFVDSEKVTTSRKRKRSSSESLELSDRITVDETEDSPSSNDEPVKKKKPAHTKEPRAKEKRKIGRMERLKDNLSDPHYPEMWAKLVVAGFCLKPSHDLLVFLQNDRPMFHLVYNEIYKLTFNAMLQITTPKYLQYSDGTSLGGKELKTLIFETEDERKERKREEKERKPKQKSEVKDGKGGQELSEKKRYALIIDKSNFLLEKEVIDRINDIAKECSLDDEELEILLAVTRGNAFTFTVDLVRWLQHYLPLDNDLLKKLSYLDPIKIKSSKSLEAVKFIAPKFIGYLEGTEMENIYREWISLQADLSVLNPNYKEYELQVEAGISFKNQIRIDVIYSPLLKKKTSLSKFLKAVLCISHGTHNVEGSINDLRNVLGDRGHSMKDSTITNRLMVKSAVRANTKAKCCHEHDFGTKSHIIHWKEAHKKVDESTSEVCTSDGNSSEFESETRKENVNEKISGQNQKSKKKESKRKDKESRKDIDKESKKRKSEEKDKPSKKRKSEEKDKPSKKRKSEEKDKPPKKRKSEEKDKPPKKRKSEEKDKPSKKRNSEEKDKPPKKTKSKEKEKDKPPKKRKSESEESKKLFDGYKIPKQPKITQFLNKGTS